MQYDDAVKALVELAASRHNAFHSFEAAEIGIHAHRLRRAELRGELRRLHPRVWSVAALPSSPAQSLRGACLSVGGAAATTTSAAWLHGWLPAAGRPPQLWVPSANSRNHPVADLRRCRLVEPSLDLTVVGHIPCLNKAATLCLLGAAIDAVELERCLDEFLRTESERWLDETVERLRGARSGSVSALQRVRSDPRRVHGIAESWFERVLSRLVRLPWIPPIELQHEIVVDGVRHRIDVACPDLKLGVEAHSRSFHWGPGTEDADNVRDLRLAAAGWELLYVTWSQLRDPTSFVDLFADAARARAEQLGIDLAA